MLNKAFGVLLLAGLAGCVAPPPVLVSAPLAPQQSPFVAVPGPGKTEAAFRTDDAACRNAPSPRPAPGNFTGNSTGNNTANPAATADPTTGYTPGVGYLQCMEARNNLVVPMPASAPPAVYGYLPSYPVYVGPWYGYGYPWYFGSVGFGFFGGYRYGWGYPGYGYRSYGYGYRGFGGYHGYGGYRGGYGGPGGFHGGGGFGRGR